MRSSSLRTGAIYPRLAHLLGLSDDFVDMMSSAMVLRLQEFGN